MSRRNTTPLTDAQRDLAGDPRHVRYALFCAAPFRAQWPWLAEDIDSAALVGLVEAARTYDPARGFRFTTLLDRRSKGAIRDYLRAMVPGLCRRAKRNPPGRLVRLPLARTDCGRAEDVVAADDLPTGWEAASEAGVCELTKGLPPKHRQAVRAYFLLAGATCKTIGRGMGVGESRASQIVGEAVAMLREKHTGGRRL